MNPAINLDALLKSTTFQGMSDDEIQAIIDYKLQTLEVNLRTEFASELQTREQSEMCEATIEASKIANNAFERALNLAVNYQTV